MGKHNSTESDHVIYGPAPFRFSPLPDVGEVGRFYKEFRGYARLFGRKYLRRQKSVFAKIEHHEIGRARYQGKTGEPLYRKSVITGIPMVTSRVGMIMEDSAELLSSINEEVEESKRILEDLENKVRKISDDVNPRLLEQAKRLRESRMTAVSEINQSLKALQEIRKFFLGSDYKTEIERLKEFVGLCKELKELRDDGTLDAIATVSIRMALKEESE